jgi:hypothetical protein
MNDRPTNQTTSPTAIAWHCSTCGGEWSTEQHARVCCAAAKQSARLPCASRSTVVTTTTTTGFVPNPLMEAAAADRHVGKCCANRFCRTCGSHVSGYNANGRKQMSNPPTTPPPAGRHHPDAPWCCAGCGYPPDACGCSTTQITTAQRAACQSMGTKQCAAICLSHFPTWDWLSGCPEAGRVWTDKAIARERNRRPTGPLGLVT